MYVVSNGTILLSTISANNSIWRYVGRRGAACRKTLTISSNRYLRSAPLAYFAGSPLERLAKKLVHNSFTKDPQQ